MDEKKLNALTALAAKLGTTAEYLWAAMLRQAPVAGVAELIFIALWGAIVVWLAGCMRRRDRDTQDVDAIMLGWAGVLVMAALCLIYVAARLNMILAAFFNPEYWALMHIMR